MKVRLLCVGICLMVAGVLRAGSPANFDDLSLAANSYWNGSNGSGGFTSGSASFNNSFTDWGGGFTSWEGWAYSNKSDTTTAGYTNQYSAITGAAHSGSNYGIAYIGWTESPSITLNSASIVNGIYVTNTTYAALDMRNGNQYGFSKKFGGESGNDADWFKLTITGKDSFGDVTGTVVFYLADFRFADNSKDYIVDMWKYVDLSSLGAVNSLEFALSSSDTGYGYMNTPAYFAIDTIMSEVFAPIQCSCRIMPATINRKSNQPHIFATIRLPEGITSADIDRNEPLVLYRADLNSAPANGGIEASRQWIIPCNANGRKLVGVIACFDKDDLMDAVGQNDSIELKVGGKLKTGQYFCGTDTIRIIH